MSRGVLRVSSPGMQNLSPTPVGDFARVRVLARSVTSAAAENDSSSNNPSCQLQGSASHQHVLPTNSPRTLAFHVRHAQLLAAREVNHPGASSHGDQF